jgi:hypothetical protein
MTTRDAPIIERKDMQFFRLQAVVKAGANCLGIDGGPVSRTWIRKTFRVDQNT